MGLLHVTHIWGEPEIEAVLEVEVKKEFGLDAEKDGNDKR